MMTRFRALVPNALGTLEDRKNVISCATFAQKNIIMTVLILTLILFVLLLLLLLSLINIFLCRQKRYLTFPWIMDIQWPELNCVYAWFWNSCLFMP